MYVICSLRGDHRVVTYADQEPQPVASGTFVVRVPEGLVENLYVTMVVGQEEDGQDIFETKDFVVDPTQFTFQEVESAKAEFILAGLPEYDHGGVDECNPERGQQQGAGQ